MGESPGCQICDLVKLPVQQPSLTLGLRLPRPPLYLGLRSSVHQKLSLSRKSLATTLQAKDNKEGLTRAKFRVVRRAHADFMKERG